ncbi:MAG: hypothetical protein ACF8SC_10360 [Phycisphaerales bacterium JB037]
MIPLAPMLPVGLMIRTEPLLPSAIVIPVAAVTMLALTIHLASLRNVAMPESRRRIRIANAVLMMFATGLLGYALGVATMSDASGFVLSWTAAASMLVMIGTLAVADVLNTWRMQRAETRDIRRQIRRLRGELIALVEERRRAAGASERER